MNGARKAKKRATILVILLGDTARRKLIDVLFHSDEGIEADYEEEWEGRMTSHTSSQEVEHVVRGEVSADEGTLPLVPSMAQTGKAF